MKIPMYKFRRTVDEINIASHVFASLPRENPSLGLLGAVSIMMNDTVQTVEAVIESFKWFVTSQRRD